MKKTIIFAFILSLLVMTVACNGDTAATDFSEADIALVISGKTFAINDPVEAILETLGEDFEYSEMVSGTYDGFDKLYDYGTITVATVPPEGKDLIAAVYVLGGDQATTSKGIKIGSTLDEVEAAYGKGYTLDDDMLSYWAGPKNDIKTPTLCFSLDGESKVAEMSLFSARSAG